MKRGTLFLGAPETPTEIAVAVISGIVQVAVELTSSQAVPTLSPRVATLAAVQAIEGIAGKPASQRTAPNHS